MDRTTPPAAAGAAAHRPLPATSPAPPPTSSEPSSPHHLPPSPSQPALAHRDPPGTSPVPPGYQQVFRAQPTEGPQRKIQRRNRPPVSCLSCRNRKVKCDRQQPCERCIKSGDAEQCEYAPRLARRSRDTEARHHPNGHPNGRPKPEAGSKPVLQERLRSLEEMVASLVNDSHSSQSSQTFRSARSSEFGFDERNGAANGYALTPNPTVPPSLPGPASLQMSEGNYVGNSHYASILRNIQDIQGILDTDVHTYGQSVEVSVSPPPSASCTLSGGYPGFMSSKAENLTHQEAMARLPGRHQTDRLILLYFQNKFTIVPYIHTGKFQKEYDRFWTDVTSVSQLWISCLASILCIATSVAIEKGDKVMPDPPDLDQLRGLSVDCLHAGQFLRGGPYSIEALLLNGYTEMRTTAGVNANLWVKFGLTVRLAQRLGYHRDPKYLSNITPFEGEMRRRTWAWIEVFDVLYSFQQGVPPVIREDECDTEDASNLLDSDFDESMMVLPAPRPASEPTSTLYVCIKTKLGRLLRRVLRLTLIRPPAYEEVAKLNYELQSYYEQIPSPLQIRPIRSYSFTDPTHHIMHRLMLEMMYQRTLCVLNRPYLTLERDKPECEESRNICRQAALRILDLHAEYEEESKLGGRMYDDRYLLQSLTLYDFLIASTILCLDLTENPYSSLEDRLRKMQAIGASYKIWSERKHTSQEAAHATRVVGAILRKISLQDARATPSHPPQPDVRDVHLARLLNNDNTHQTPQVTNASYDRPQQIIPELYSSLDYIDTAPMDSFLKESNINDWTSIDHFLHNVPDNVFYISA